ncbi:HpcH/HpaI aldolase/citrate lyase family protein [Streptomyces sp. ST2-7A]|uniref:HpcH/HpaI aldolase family protein n=1 Tax=Streptomyces sp. ST2-7A TaxID=2907214 RepID=UPI001F479C9A|nr:aldolase/citrate lyase family protein [Streptomyces sp. ST2-7A]MCE7079525.1 aldolase/citrate lyase family protein [Streptomyces sp. ST2-7A]
MSAPSPADFARRLRGREQLLGYWVACDNPVGTERLAGLGYDYIGVDGQHGVMHQPGWQSAMMAVDARGRAAGVIRVPSADPVVIGTALDTGARGVIVPMIETPEEVLTAVRACRHRPDGRRSLSGPVRAEIRLGGVPADIDRQVACVVMIETESALESIDSICATPGLDAVYVGPADLSVALGARYFGDPRTATALETALERIVVAAEHADLACGIHCLDGESAAKRLAQGFTFATVSSDITHLQQVALEHLEAARARTTP